MQAGHRPHQGRLAGPVRAEHRDHLPVPQGEGDVFEDRRGAVAGREPGDVEHPVLADRRRGIPVPAFRGEVPGAEIGLAHLRIGADPGGWSVRDARARVEHVDVVGDLHDEGHVVLHDDDRDPGLRDPPEQPPEVRGVLVPETGRRLIEKEDGGTDGEGAGDLDEPFVHVREGGRRLFHRPRVTDEGEQGLHRLGRVARVT